MRDLATRLDFQVIELAHNNDSGEDIELDTELKSEVYDVSALRCSTLRHDLNPYVCPT